jgi:HSP20 family protein
MRLVHWQSFPEIDALQRQMDRLLDDSILPRRRDRDDLFLTPAAELSETADAIYLKLELPGIDAQDLNIEVTQDTISISAERKQEAKTESHGVTRSEFRYGQFQRVMTLPTKIQHKNVTADYKNGILSLTLPKAEAEQNKVVKVSLG